MKLLLDTHVLLWWLAEPDRLSRRSRECMADRRNPLYFSAASSWEIAIKQALGKIQFSGPLASVLPQAFQDQAVTPLPVEHAHAFRVAELPPHHRDPFDRMLVAQAQLEDLKLLTGDPRFREYDVEIVW